MNQRNKILVLSVISLSGLSMAQQSQFSQTIEHIVFESLAEKSLPTKIFQGHNTNFLGQYF